MSDTIVDMPKVTQMLDAGWVVQLERSGMGSYVAHAKTRNLAIWIRAKERTLTATIEANKGDGGLPVESLIELNNQDFHRPGHIDTDDFTPEQALTRLAYKVHGEII